MNNREHSAHNPPSSQHGNRAFLSPTFWFAESTEHEAIKRVGRQKEVIALSAIWREICEAALRPSVTQGSAH